MARDLTIACRRGSSNSFPWDRSRRYQPESMLQGGSAGITRMIPEINMGSCGLRTGHSGTLMLKAPHAELTRTALIGAEWLLAMAGTTPEISVTTMRSSARQTGHSGTLMLKAPHAELTRTALIGAEWLLAM